MDQLLGLVDLLFRVRHDQTVQILLLIARVSGIGSTLAFLDRAFPTDGNLGLRFRLHLLERVSTGTNE